MMFYLKSSWDFIFLTNPEYFPLWCFQTQVFARDKKIHNPPILDNLQLSDTTEIWNPIGGRPIVVREITTQI